MKFDKKSLLLYAVTDGGECICERVKEALRGGVTMVQLRKKGHKTKGFINEAREIQRLCREYNVPFIVNDDADLAKLLDADGVHVGQHDMSAEKVREIIGDTKIIGVSAQTAEQAEEAERVGADYLGVGAVFATSSKADAEYVSYDTLKDICARVKIPVAAIGGIDAENVSKLAESGICGVAVISAIFGAEDIKSAAECLKAEAEKAVNV